MGHQQLHARRPEGERLPRQAGVQVHADRADSSPARPTRRRHRGRGLRHHVRPKGRLWLGNFGFQSPVCAEGPNAASNNSVSLFRPDGKPLSPAKGFTAGRISWPQGTASDQRGNIWIANCGNDSVTIYPNGDPKRARNLHGRASASTSRSTSRSTGAAGPGSPATTARTWRSSTATGSGGSAGRASISRWASPATPRQHVDRQLGAGRRAVPRRRLRRRAIWRLDHPRHQGRQVAPGSPFTGGGVTSPWGVAVDGNDQVWVANFSNGQGKVGPELMRLSQFCGTRPENCPPGKRTGDPISPGYGLHQRRADPDDGGRGRPVGQSSGPPTTGRSCRRRTNPAAIRS